MHDAKRLPNGRVVESVHAHTHACTHAHTNARTRAPWRAHAHAHTHTHTPNLADRGIIEAEALDGGVVEGVHEARVSPGPAQGEQRGRCVLAGKATGVALLPNRTDAPRRISTEDWLEGADQARAGRGPVERSNALHSAAQGCGLRRVKGKAALPVGESAGV